MHKLVTPKNMNEFNIAGTAYIADEDGFVHSDNADHTDTLKRFGCFDPVTEVDPEAPPANPDAPSTGEDAALIAELRSQVEMRDHQLGVIRSDIVALGDAIVALELPVLQDETPLTAAARLLTGYATAMPEDAPADDAGTDAADKADDASEGISGKLVRPAEDATRDDLVEWLNTNRVEGTEDVSPSISKANAWKAVDELLAAKA